MAEKKRVQPTGRKPLPPQPSEQEAEIYRIFNLMGLAARPSDGYIETDFKEPTILKSHPYGVKFIERTGS